jgi:hypothetical protein
MPGPLTVERQSRWRLGMGTPDYPTQVRHAQLVYDVFPFDAYGVGHHTLVHYANRGRCSTCDYRFAPAATNLPGYRRIHSRDDRAVFQRIGVVERPLDDTRFSTCAPFLRMLYSAYRQRIEPRLRGPANLPWRICLDR